MGDPSLAGSSDTTAAKLHAYLRPLSFVLILFLPPSSAGHETAAVCPPECEFKYHFHYLTRKMSCNRFHDIKCSSILLYFAHCFTNISKRNPLRIPSQLNISGNPYMFRFRYHFIFSMANN